MALSTFGAMAALMGSPTNHRKLEPHEKLIIKDLDLPELIPNIMSPWDVMLRGEEKPFVLPEILNTNELRSANEKIAAACIKEEQDKKLKAQEKRAKKSNK